MVTGVVISSEDAWNLLQQPACPADLEPRYRMLLSALDAGWRVDEPVYLRPRWGEVGPLAYLFILRKPALSAPRLLLVPAGSEVDRLVQDEGFLVATN